MTSTADQEGIRSQTDRILASPHFTRSATLNRFLRFVIEETLDGHDQELKEYRLGVDVFDRGDDFDPRIDPIVRMQAAKLRARLAEYYAAEGKDDACVIAIPKGGYIPSFEMKKPAAPVVRDVQSIAVLPFVSLSSDADNEYFTDGLTEELINVLAYVPGLRVVARTSVFCFKNSARDVREIGAQLNVRTVLEGSVRKAGNQLRITAQLIDVRTGYHLMSRTFPREMKDVFALQEELAGAVVSEIMPQMKSETGQWVRSQTDNMEAYNLYLKGMYTAGRGFKGPAEAIAIFKEVLEKDPGYAPAWAGLGYTYTLMAWFLAMPAKIAMPLARSAALRAIELDPGIGLAHSVLGVVCSAFDWDWEKSESYFRKAIELQPNLASAYQALGYCCLMPQGKYREAISAVERAVELNPLDPILVGTCIFIYGSVGDLVAAQRQYVSSKESFPSHTVVEAGIGVAHQKHGNIREAIAHYRSASALASRPQLAIGNLGQALAVCGETAAAREHLRELLAGNTYCFAAAMLYAGLSEKAEAIHWLEKSRENREPHVITANFDPRLAGLQDEPEFWHFLGQIGLVSATAA